jgi:hypothetical protein
VTFWSPTRRLVQTWRMLMDPTAAAEGFSRLTWEIEGPGQDGVCRLTVTHELAGMPSLYAMTSGNNEFGAAPRLLVEARGRRVLFHAGREATPFGRNRVPVTCSETPARSR